MRAALLLLWAALPLAAEPVRVVVALADGGPRVEAAAPQFSRELEALGVRDIERWDRGGRVFSAVVDSTQLAALERDPRVRAVELDRGGGGALRESIPLIGADLAHAAGYDGRGITVAIVDSGIDDPNPDFAGRIVAEQCYCDNLDGTGCCPDGQTEQSGAGAAMDDHGHGTHVSGILAGGGASAPAGVAPAAHIVAVKVMDSANRFKSFTQIYRALEWIVEQHPEVRVVNMSLGSSALYRPAECDASAVAIGLSPLIETLRARGVLITASAGNESSVWGITLPACMERVIGVGATYDAGGSYTWATCSDPHAVVDGVACFTNMTTAVDIVAPGAVISASRRGGGETVFVGTSMAAPHVAGTIALMLQACGTMTASELEHLLLSTGRTVIDSRTQLAVPRLDAGAAVAAAAVHAAQQPRRRSVRHGG